MKTALPTARALGLQGAAPDPWITLYRSEPTYFADSAVQRSGASAPVEPGLYRSDPRLLFALLLLALTAFADRLFVRR